MTEQPDETSPSMPFQPTKPIMGGLLQVDNSMWAVWTGGKPNSDWTALYSSAIQHNRTPFLCIFAKDATALMLIEPVFLTSANSAKL